MTDIADRSDDAALAESIVESHHDLPDDAPAFLTGEVQPEDAKGVRAVLRKAVSYGDLRNAPYGLRPAIMFIVIGFFSKFDGRAWILAAPDFAQDLEINVGDIIGIQVTVGVVLIFASVGLGWYGDRHRRVPMLAMGTMLSGLLTMVQGRAGSFAQMAAPRIVDDTASLAGGVPTLSLLTDYYPTKYRGRVFALLGVAGRVGTIAAPIVVGVILVQWGWRTLFYVLGAPLAIVGFITFFVLKEPPRGLHERVEQGIDPETAKKEDEPPSFGEAWRTVWGVRTLRRLFIGDIFIAGADQIVGLFFIFLMADEYGLDGIERGLVYTPAAVTAVFGAFIGGGLIDRFIGRNPGRVLTLVGIGPIFSVTTAIMYGLQPPIWLLVVVSAIFGFTGSLIGPAVSVVYTQVIPPNARTQGLTMTGLAGAPAAIIALPLAGIINAQYGYSTVFYSTIPLWIIGGAIYATSGQFFEVDMRRAYSAAKAREDWRTARATGQDHLLVLRGVDVEYEGGVQVLFDVDITVDAGEVVALLGTNGAGKSTVLRAIGGLTQASSGAVLFDGRDITAMPPHEIAAKGIITMPGGRGIFPGLTVRENLVLGNWLAADDGEEVVRERLAEVFEIFPRLLERSEIQASLLSGGEQQQLSLAQAFLARPKVLIIDELSLGLSPVVVGELIEIVRRLNERGITIIVVEQSVNVALTLAKRAIFMEKGQVRFDGPTDELMARPDILRAIYVKGTGALTSGAPASAQRSERDGRAMSLTEARPVLEVESIVKRYGGVLAVNGVSFDLRDGEVLGLIGPNGAGKTTLFEIVSGFQDADEGAIRFEGVDITKMSPQKRADLGLIRRFQDARMFPTLSVYETVLIALEKQLEVRNSLLSAMAAPPARKAEKRLRVKADNLIDLLGLGTYRDKRVRELSTGLRRIADLACVLAAEPKVLLLDEPSSGIAQAEAEGLAPLLRRIRRETGCSILIIEHDMPLISAVSDELIAFDLGTFVTRGTPTEVLNNPSVIESYLGTSEASIKRSGSIE